MEFNRYIRLMADDLNSLSNWSKHGYCVWTCISDNKLNQINI